jgi:hypothetical protein
MVASVISSYLVAYEKLKHNAVQSCVIFELIGSAPLHPDVVCIDRWRGRP